MSELTADAIKQIVSLANKRDAVITLNDGSGRMMVYNDQKKAYDELPRIVVLKRSVSNIESFAAAVLEECRRRQRNEGEGATVVFTKAGGWFSPDDMVDLDRWTYGREASPQWFLIGNGNYQSLPHKDFLVLLQKLRPSLKHPSIISDFRRLDFESTTNLTSQPVMIDGKGGSAFAVRFTAKSGQEGQAAVPSEIALAMEFARGSLNRVEITGQVDIWLDDKRSLKFSLSFPDRETVQEEAISLEVAWFREQVKGLPRLLILEDY